MCNLCHDGDKISNMTTVMDTVRVTYPSEDLTQLNRAKRFNDDVKKKKSLFLSWLHHGNFHYFLHF